MGLLFAFGASLFAGPTSILAKLGITGVESNLGTAIRTGVVLVMSWVMVLVTKKQGEVKKAAGLAAITAGTLIMLLPTLRGG